MITVNKLVKFRDRTAVLDDIDLEVKPGEVTTIIGPSGGGKSTLLRCLNGLESFEGGTVVVDGICLSAAVPAKATLLELRRKVGMVFQQFNLFGNMTALENIMAGPRYALGQSRQEAEGVALALLERVGLPEKRNAKPEELSGGQQQRVAIARALAVKPSVLLFDEPTSALDPIMADEVLKVITELAQSGQTMVVVTHAMGFARKVSRQVVVMERGSIVEQGTPEQVFEQPRRKITQDFLNRERK